MAELDKYKQAILDVYQSTNKNIFVKATAGSGKTYLLLQLMKNTQPFKRCLFLAFNKSIAEELSRKVPDGIEVATIHSKAFKTLLGAFHYKPKIVENKNFLVAKKVISEEPFGENRKRYFSYLYNIIGLYNLLNLNLAFTFEDARKVCEMYGEEMNEYLWKDITAIDIKRTKDESRLQMNDFCELDFTDMLLLTYKYVPDERFPKYDVVFIDEAQDLNPLQRELILKMIKPNGRFIAVGDDKQTIYSFQGSNLNSFEMLSSRPNTEIMPLSMTYRCGKKIVEAAKEIFPEGIEAYEGNEDGIVRRGNVFEAREGDYVLCRNNFPLVEVFIKLISQRKKAVILGKDFGKSILNILDKINSLDELDELLVKCAKLLKEEGIQRPTFHPRYISLQEKCDIIRLVYRTVGETFISTKELIEEMFGDDNGASAVTLTTIHKSKGLEADRVFFLQPDLIPSKYAQTDLELYGERCLKFVAITRAKKELIFC